MCIESTFFKLYCKVWLMKMKANNWDNKYRLAFLATCLVLLLLGCFNFVMSFSKLVGGCKCHQTHFYLQFFRLFCYNFQLFLTNFDQTFISINYHFWQILQVNSNFLHKIHIEFWETSQIFLETHSLFWLWKSSCANDKCGYVLRFDRCLVRNSVLWMKFVYLSNDFDWKKIQQKPVVEG